MAGFPTECIPLSKSKFAANCVVVALGQAKMLAHGVEPKTVVPVVDGLLNAGCTSPQIAGALIAASFIAQGFTGAAVTDVIDKGLEEAKAPRYENWSCCKDSDTGYWFPYHEKLGWDFNIPC